MNPSVAQQGLKDNAAVHARENLRLEKAAFLERARALYPNARVVASVQIVLNAVFVEVDASVLPQLANDPAVARIAPVADYELYLFETAPYIGASAVQNSGLTGRGSKVAVLDSGIDYTHAALGGSGDPADFASDDPTVIEPGTFPAAKVVGGYDFVGVAPGADLCAVKVCSSVSSSCSGIALIRGMEYSANPNGAGRLNDRVDIINMSLGSNYGRPFDDDPATAVDNATQLGILTVASASNSSDKPYVSGTPATVDSAPSVAQTAVPSGFLPLMQILAPAGLVGNFPAVFQSWSAPLVDAIEGPVQ